MRLHVLGLPHTQVNKDYVACAFTQKILNFCKMMHRTGYEVILYSGEHADTEYTENVVAWTDADQLRWFGKFEPDKLFPIEYNSTKNYWTESNGMLIKELATRLEPDDIICSIGGNCHKIISQIYPNKLVEFGIGYTGVFSKYRVFESYPHMHFIYGMLNDDNGHFFDAVIPNYMDVNDFPFNPPDESQRSNYGFLGRCIKRKGIEFAIETVEALDDQLIIAGQGLTQNGPFLNGIDFSTSSDNVRYIGSVGVKERTQFLSHIKALFVPTTYLEPFGAVALEASFCGTPVITTDFGAFSDTIKHGFNGYRVRTVGEAVQACQNLDKLAPRKEIRDYAVANYSLERIALLYDDYFQQLSYSDEGEYTKWSGRLDRYQKF